MKSIRLLLALVLIPTFVVVAICICPNANASSLPTGLSLSGKSDCCCPDGTRNCAKTITIQKENGTAAPVFSVEKAAFQGLTSFEEILFSSNPRFFDLASNVSPPIFRTLQISTVQLLI